MMLQECMGTCYIYRLLVVVPAWDPKDRFVERVSM
jgi:hypothetical protein